jgi:hypothetical protein
VNARYGMRDSGYEIRKRLHICSIPNPLSSISHQASSIQHPTSRIFFSLTPIKSIQCSN